MLATRIRPNAYKNSFLTRSQAIEFGTQLFPEIEKARLQLESKQLSPAEFCAHYFLLFLKIFRPKDWRGGPHNYPDLVNIPHHQNSDLEVFRIFSLRSIPLSVNKTLSNWSEGTYPLLLYFRIPTPLEVLEMQTQGFRCVTALSSFEDLTQSYPNNKDPWSFLTHDLIHADHFFSNTALKTAQIQFYKTIYNMIGEKHFDSFIKDYTFKAEFEYLYSDMNTHVVHMFKYLKAILAKSSIENSGSLKDMEALITQLAQQLSQPELALAALKKLNTQDEDDSTRRQLFDLMTLPEQMNLGDKNEVLAQNLNYEQFNGPL